MSENVINPMTEARRELNLRILNGERNAVYLPRITQLLYFLDQHFPPKHLVKALIWLITHGYVGRTFISWFDNQCKASPTDQLGSNLEMHRLLLSVVENDILKPIIAGKNFVQ